LAALSDDGPARPAGSRIAGAHHAAVADTLGYLERRAAWTRRGAEHRRIPVSGLVAAGFCHAVSWSGDPHLHSHIVVANLALGEDGTWSCLDSRALYRHRQGATAVYQASLRHQLAAAGFHLRWTVRPDGLADVVGVPRAAIEACSTRRQAILQASDDWEPMSAAARTAAAGRTRRQHELPSESWQDRAAGAGLDRAAAGTLLARAPSDRTVAPEPTSGGAGDDLAAVVDARLCATVSSFDHADCVRLAAAYLRHGASAQAIETWARGFLDTAIPVDGGRWVTATLRQRQRQVAELAGRPAAGVGLARPEAVERALADRPGLGPIARDAVEALASSGAGVQRLGPGSFLDQVAVLESAQAAWEASGHRVAVITPNRRAAERWHALCGLRPPPPRPHHASIVIVDNADRLCTADLHRIIADGTSRRAKVILVEGGTGAAPCRQPGPAFDELRELLPAVDTGRAVVTATAFEPVRGGLDHTVAVAPTSHDAFHALVADWAAARAGPEPAVMVALGRHEAAGLNDLARQWLAASGTLHGPAVTAGGQEWRAGDELRVLRRHRLLRSTPAGTVGSVTRVDPGRATITIGWPAGSMTVTAQDLGRAPAVYAYATTPAYLRYWSGGPVLSLGDPARAGPGLVSAPNLYLVAHPPPDREAASGPLGRLVSDLAATRHSKSSARRRPTDRYAGWSLAQLADHRAALADRLTASAPADVAPEQRRLEDDRAWQRARRHPTDAFDERSRALAAAAESRRRWLETHAGEVDEWVGLGRAISFRAGALAVAAEARPSRLVLAEIGPRPPDEHEAGRWRQAAQQLESFRDRWCLADDPAGLPQTLGDGGDGALRRDLIRAMAATRTVTQDRALSRGPPRRHTGDLGGIRTLLDGARADELFRAPWRSTMTPSLTRPQQPVTGATSRLAGCCAG
jgi:hypothetical protein